MILCVYKGTQKMKTRGEKLSTYSASAPLTKLQKKPWKETIQIDEGKNKS